MAKGKKTGGRDFVPGVVTNPNGRPPLSPEAKAIRKLTADKLEEIGDLILDGNKVQLNAISSSLEESAIRVAYAKAALNAMAKGDLSMLEMILNRVVGRVKERVEHSGTITLEKLLAGANEPGIKKD
jgi:hypothetical protein